VAVVEHSGPDDAVARADADLDFLGLEIRGTSEHSSRQTVEVGSGVTLTGRNEMRVSKRGVLKLAGGTVGSLRWVDVKAGGELQGRGSVGATLYNGGVVTVDKQLGIASSYIENKNAMLHLAVCETGCPGLKVAGTAELAGRLSVSVDPGVSMSKGKTFTVVSAKTIQGTFLNAGGQVVAGNGVRFETGYENTRVTLTAK
jgi:hypothetical protein